MNYTEKFIQDVLSLVTDERVKSLILSGQMSIGEFLTKYSEKGVDSKVILDCIEKKDLKTLERLACHQERIKAYFKEWQECYLLRHGPTYKQAYINKEMEKMFGGKNHFLNLKYNDKIEKQRSLAAEGIYDNNSILASVDYDEPKSLTKIEEQPEELVYKGNLSEERRQELKKTWDEADELLEQDFDKPFKYDGDVFSRRKKL